MHMTDAKNKPSDCGDDINEMALFVTFGFISPLMGAYTSLEIKPKIFGGDKILYISKNRYYKAETHKDFNEILEIFCRFFRAQYQK